MAARYEDPRLDPVMKVLRELVAEKGLTMKEADRLAGYRGSKLSKVTSGHLRLTMGIVYDVLEALDVAPAEFHLRVARAMDPEVAGGRMTEAGVARIVEETLRRQARG